MHLVTPWPHNAAGDLPVKKGITDVPPPTAVMTRELPRLQEHINLLRQSYYSLQAGEQLELRTD